MALLVKSRGVTLVSWPNSRHWLLSIMASTNPHPLDWALWLSLLSTCSWCVVSAYTWLTLWLSLLSTCELVCGDRIHVTGSMTLSPPPPVGWCVVESIHWLDLWLSLLSTCSWCGWAYNTWTALWLSLLSTCSWLFVVSAYTWLLYDSLSSPPVAGVWWVHTLDWLYDSLSSPPVAGVWWEHTLDWIYDSLSSPPVAGVWWAHTLDWIYDSLSPSPVLVCGESIHLIDSMTLSSLHL